MTFPTLSRHVAAIATLFATAIACGATTEAPSESVPAPPPRDAGPPAEPSAPATPAASTPPPSPGPAADAGVPTEGSDVELGGPAVQLVGRFDTRDGRGPICGFPACRIVARFEGTSTVSVKLEGIYYPDWMEGVPSEWDVAVDGVVTQKIVVTLGEHEFPVAGGLSPGVHVVELYKRSEAQTGLGRLLGLDLHGGTLLAPPKRRARRLEIIGDSQPAAFGVESGGLGPNCPGIQWSGAYQNFRKSFGAVLGERFGAEVFGTVYSGKGVAQNIWSTDDETMPVIYRRANPIDRTSTWDFGWSPDAIVIMLGGNDFAIGQPFDRGPTTLAAFTDAYVGFVAELRGHYPSALVVLAVSPSVTDTEPPGRQSRTNVAAGVHAVVVARAAAGDSHVVEVAPKLATPAELVGCNGHGTPAFHQRVADELAPLLASSLGW